nr:hypothetical protein [Tanacetum cinerariifolium]
MDHWIQQMREDDYKVKNDLVKKVEFPYIHTSLRFFLSFDKDAKQASPVKPPPLEATKDPMAEVLFSEDTTKMIDMKKNGEDCGNLEEFMVASGVKEAAITTPIMVVAEKLGQKLIYDFGEADLMLGSERKSIENGSCDPPEENCYQPYRRVVQSHNMIGCHVMRLKRRCGIYLGHLETIFWFKQGSKRRVWDPDITCLKILKEHLENKVVAYKSKLLFIPGDTVQYWNYCSTKVLFIRELKSVIHIKSVMTNKDYHTQMEEQFYKVQYKLEAMMAESALKEDLGQKLIDDLDEPLIVPESYRMINKNDFADGDVAPVVVVAPVAAVALVEQSFVPLGRIKQNQAEHHNMFIWKIIL